MFLEGDMQAIAFMMVNSEEIGYPALRSILVMV
jgi:hypothetical protein